MPTLYNLRRTDTGYTMVKFDDDFNLAAIYNLTPDRSGLACDCPAGLRPTCKHRKMVPIFAKAGQIDTSVFYCYETQAWHQPIAGPWDQDDPTARKAAESEEESPPSPSKAEPEIALHINLPPDADVAEEFSKLLGSTPVPQPPKSIRRV